MAIPIRLHEYVSPDLAPEDLPGIRAEVELLTHDGEPLIIDVVVGESAEIVPAAEDAAEQQGYPDAAANEWRGA